MTCEIPFWVRLARKEPQRAIVRGRVFEIGAPDESDGAVLLTVWEKGRVIGHVLPTHPPTYRACSQRAETPPRRVDGVEDLLEILVPTRVTAVAARRAARG
ncbi:MULTISPECIES: hypothetical protein [unclassified Rathayibacter]|uniref:hypothetical protein n=1 Tax=unclassified Rathayibacter TaxID=2609250 RepID=UPI00188C158C|nr:MULTISPECIES: hypothetical protein [unclassified Rathayibacter]MBF4463029.1 hypothetical protein [Rathayibacter sp. VKM Ac-2879]MBF4504734.1 hypothetical protein [Rathayibacter sp. VKM Ac-2878]